MDDWSKAQKRRYESSAYLADGFSRENREHIAELARIHRKRLGLDQEEMSKLCGVRDRFRYSDVETANRRASYSDIARVVNIVLKVSPPCSKGKANVEGNFRPESPAEGHPKRDDRASPGRLDVHDAETGCPIVVAR